MISLVPVPPPMHKAPMTQPDIFDRSLRARRRDRMMAHFADHDFLYRAMVDELLDRLTDVQRDLPEALVIGCPDVYWRKGNIEVVCARFGAKLCGDWASFVAEVVRSLDAC